MTFRPTAARTQQVLAFLADNGTITDADGKATAVVAKGVGLSVTYAGNILCALDAANCITRDLTHRRTFAITLTDKGRRALSFERAASKKQAERRAAMAAVRTAPAPPPPMPVCGPIGHLDFDPDTSRHAAMEGAYG